MIPDIEAILIEEERSPRVHPLEKLKDEILKNIKKKYTRKDIWEVLRKREIISCSYEAFLYQVRIWLKNEKHPTSEQSVKEVTLTKNKEATPIQAEKANQPIDTQSEDPYVSKFYTPSNEGNKTLKWENRTMSDEELYGRSKNSTAKKDT